MSTTDAFFALQRLAIGAMAAAWAINGLEPAFGQTSMRFSLDWKFEGTQAPFLVAVDRGYFRAEGLDVAVDTAASSFESIGRLAAETHSMGFGDINSLIRFRDQNPQALIKMVFMVYNNPAFAIIGLKSRGVTTPKSLEGKRLGAPAADSAFAQWPIFVKANDIDESKIAIMNLGFPVREPMLVSGRVDAVTALSFSSYLNVKYSGMPADNIVVMLMADYGVNLYGNGIMVGPRFAAEKPDAVRGFLRAYLKGLKDAVRDPVTAVNSILRRNDVANREIELERLQMALRDNVLTPEVRINGFGAVELARLDKAIGQIGLAHPFKSAIPRARDIFDSSFLPADSERKVF
jgi:NitT/TauT family transport system substrate-binding protein